MKRIMRMNAVLLVSLTLLSVSCDEDDAQPKVEPLTASEVKDLDATSTSKFTLYSFNSGAVVANADSASAKWDIGFRGTTIILNGGVSGPGVASGQIVDGIFDEIVEAPAAGYNQDSNTTKAIVGSGGWYTYTGTASVPNHAILPNAGKVLILKTAESKYVKVEVISYYLGNPSTGTAEFADLASRPASRYYTFRYLYQADGTTNLQATE
ncbi:HmuY family protein [Chryseolinea sp. T2]|uniref:HmuY family protein n=1 Tax=Chryseolinea sp. T2 TaxID=3129255 RepID=UPI003076CF35